MASTPRLVACVALVALVSGCSVAGPDAGDASTTVTAFTSSLASGDGEGACRLLAPATIEWLEGQVSAECAEAVLQLGLPDDASQAQAYGRQAQVRTTSDVLFLARSGDSWLITAAGCTARTDRPYDCDLEGS